MCGECRWTRSKKAENIRKDFQMWWSWSRRHVWFSTAGHTAGQSDLLKIVQTFHGSPPSVQKDTKHANSLAGCSQASLVFLWPVPTIRTEGSSSRDLLTIACPHLATPTFTLTFAPQIFPIVHFQFVSKTSGKVSPSFELWVVFCFILFFDP